MYIAMNHFRVAPERAEDFERGWRERESFLREVPGFRSFHLLRGPIDDDGARAYASHTVWRDEAAFLAWTESEAFRKAHAQGRSTAGTLLGPPRFVGWESVLGLEAGDGPAGR
jgi:heme-degrading monooxygenase HmoA